MIVMVLYGVVETLVNNETSRNETIGQIQLDYNK